MSPAMDPLLITFAAIGFFVVGSRLFSFVRLMLSLFVLPGKAVRVSITHIADLLPN